MKNKIFFLFLISLGCANSSIKNETVDYFPNDKVKGCFLLYNMRTNSLEKVINEENCRERIPPYSTFKVALAVMAFDSGILKDEKVVYKWDGKKSDREVENKDHNAVTWMKDSIVWYSQRITPQLGEKRLKSYLTAFEYGNADMSTGIKEAWLIWPDKPQALKISAFEQLEFMKKLWSNKLPASASAHLLTQKITEIETSPKGFLLSGKTGSSYYEGNRNRRVGWFISHLSKDQQEYVAVTLFRDKIPSEQSGYGGPAARDLTKKIFTDLGLW